jgi:hypothetical protein
MPWQKSPAGRPCRAHRQVRAANHADERKEGDLRASARAKFSFPGLRGPRLDLPRRACSEKY